jgi:epoxide hydrolase-like predicted phosphatase
MQGKITINTFITQVEVEAKQAGYKDGIYAAKMMTTIGGGDYRPLMISVLKKLRKAGIKVGALTNNFIEPSLPDAAAQAENDKEAAKFRALFDSFIESAVCGLTKPDPAIYKLALDSLRVAPEETCFLDDIGKNLKPARAMGMHTIHVKNDHPTQFHDAVRELETVTGVELLGNNNDLEESGRMPRPRL